MVEGLSDGLIRAGARRARQIAGRLAVVIGLVLPGAAAAQDAGGFALELNNMTSEADACRVTLVARNGLGVPIDAISLEVVVFDLDGLVDRFLLFEFGRLTVGKTRVVPFDLQNTTCEGISRILINDVVSCETAELEPSDCMAALKVTSRQPVDFGL